MFIHPKFWPLDFDQESEIYDIPSWNLPGRMKRKRPNKLKLVPLVPKP